MAKPPKKLPGAHSPDSSSSPPRSPADDRPPSAERTAFSQPGQRFPSVTDSAAPILDMPTAPDVQPPTVTVIDLPGLRTQVRDAYLKMIAWPGDKVDQLRPIGNDTGLFQGPDGKTYAPIAGDGYYWVESTPRGFQVPLPFAPDVSGPFLSKIEGQPLWRVERPDWFPESALTPPRASETSSETISFIPPHLASTLTDAHESTEGIRYDTRKRTYVDMAQGTVMVQRNADGSYQQKSASERGTSGALLEQITGTKIWRRRPEIDLSDQEIPGPSKRTRIGDEDAESDDTHRFTQTLESLAADPLDLSSGQWRNWGKSTRPESGESIEVDGLYYRIVPQGSQLNIAYLEHPRFSPSRYDAFEQMLREEPSLQPRWARKENNRWDVLEARLPFAQSITQTIAARSRYLADHTVEALARAVFNRASQSGVINGLGLSVVNQTLRFWSQVPGTRAPHRDLADPLLMLPIQATQLDLVVPAGLLKLPPQSTAELQRLDFDPQKLPRQWNQFLADPNDSALHLLFKTLLTDNGYEMHPSPRPLQENAMVFHRKDVDAVFVLKLPLVNGDTVSRYTYPGAEARSSVFQLSLDEANRARLNEHLARGNVVYLVGGIQHFSPHQQSLFIVREG